MTQTWLRFASIMVPGHPFGNPGAAFVDTRFRGGAEEAPEGVGLPMNQPVHGKYRIGS